MSIEDSDLMNKRWALFFDIEGFARFNKLKSMILLTY